MVDFEKALKDSKAARAVRDGKRTVRRKTETVASVGSKDDAKLNAAGSEAIPVVEREDGPGREVDIRDYSLVSVSYGLTRAMGNYEFARIDVKVEDWCPRDKKDETYEELREFAARKVNTVSKGITDFVNKRLAAERAAVEKPYG